MCNYFTTCTMFLDWWFNYSPLVWAGVFIGIPVLGALYVLVHPGPRYTEGTYTTPLCSANRQPYTDRNRCNDVIYVSHRITGRETAPFKVRPGWPFYIPAKRTKEKVEKY